VASTLTICEGMGGFGRRVKRPPSRRAEWDELWADSVGGYEPASICSVLSARGHRVWSADNMPASAHW